jgi:uncharacterized protein YuzE
MKIEYYPEADFLYIRLNEGPADDSDTADEDVVVDKREGRIIGLEILEVSRHADVKQFEPYITYSSTEVRDEMRKAAAVR